MSNLLTFNIAGTDRTDKVFFESFSISDRLKSVKTCRFKVKDVSVTSNTGILITDNRTATKIFGGYITEVEKEFYKKDAYFNVCQAQDYSLILRNFQILEKKDYSAGVKSEKTILTECLTGSGITVGDHVITGANVSIIIQIGSFARAIDDLAAVNGRTWYVDYDSELHYYTEGDETASFNFSDTPNNTTTFTYGKFKYRASFDTSVGTAYGGSLVCNKAGLMSGQTVQITNATIPLVAQTFLINEISIRVLNMDTTVTDAVEYTIYFGDLTQPRMTDFITRSNQNASTVDRGLIPPLETDSTKYLSSTGAWSTPSSSLSISNLTSGNLTAIGTITTGSWQTGAAGTNRFLINSSVIGGYSSADVLQFYIASSDGKAYSGAGGLIFSSSGLQIVNSVATTLFRFSNGAYDSYIYLDSSGNLTFQGVNAKQIILSTADYVITENIWPVGTGSYSLGDTTKLWYNLYTTNFDSLGAGAVQVKNGISLYPTGSSYLGTVDYRWYAVHGTPILEVNKTVEGSLTSSGAADGKLYVYAGGAYRLNDV